MKGSSRGDISIGFRSKTLGRVVSSFSLTNNPTMSNTHFLRHVTTSLLSHCRVQLTTCLNYRNPSKQSLCLLPLLCSTQTARGVLLKHSCQISLFCLKASKSLKIQFTCTSELATFPTSLPTSHTGLRASPNIPPGLCTVGPLPPHPPPPRILFLQVPDTYPRVCFLISLRALLKRNNMASLWRSFPCPPSRMQPPPPQRFAL